MIILLLKELNEIFLFEFLKYADLLKMLVDHYSLIHPSLQQIANIGKNHLQALAIVFNLTYRWLRIWHHLLSTHPPKSKLYKFSIRVRNKLLLQTTNFLCFDRQVNLKVYD
jgi:hypothetical protein